MHFYGLSFQENDAYVKQISPLSHEFPRTPHGNPHRTPYLLSAMISCYHFLPATFSKGAPFGSQPPSECPFEEVGPAERQTVLAL